MMLTRTIRALIVEDEPLARARLRTWLGRLPDVELIGECPRGEKALAAIRDLAPDLVLEEQEAMHAEETPRPPVEVTERMLAELARALDRGLGQPRKRPERLFVKQGDGRVRVVKVADIDWIEAAGNYVKLHVGPDVHLLRGRITGLEEQLDPARFARIHRSTLVNVDRIRELQPWFHGDYVAVLRDGTQLNVSRSYRERVLGRDPSAAD
jgi:two-component system, LytTR family, response regulator